MMYSAWQNRALKAPESLLIPDVNLIAANGVDSRNFGIIKRVCFFFTAGLLLQVDFVSVEDIFQSYAAWEVTEIFD